MGPVGRRKPDRGLPRVEQRHWSKCVSSPRKPGHGSPDAHVGGDWQVPKKGLGGRGRDRALRQTELAEPWLCANRRCLMRI